MIWAITIAKVAGLRFAPEVMRLAFVFFSVVLDLRDWTAIRSVILLKLVAARRF